MKTMRTRIVLSLTATAVAAAVGLSAADSDGGAHVDRRASDVTSPQSGAADSGGAPGTASRTVPLRSLVFNAAASPGAMPSETPGDSAPGSAAPTNAAEEESNLAELASIQPARFARGPAATIGGGFGGSHDSESAVLALVNKERAAAGCGPLTENAKLSAAARAYSGTMARSGVMSHTGPDGSTVTSRVEAAGYAWSRVGENVARGQSDADEVMTAWMNSSGHRTNILDCAFREIGIGVHMGDGGPWWTQNFGAPK